MTVGCNQMDHLAANATLLPRPALRVWRDDQDSGSLASGLLNVQRPGRPGIGHWTFEVTHHGAVLIPESQLHNAEEPRYVPNANHYDFGSSTLFRYEPGGSWNPIHLTYLVGNDRSSVGYMLKEDMEEFMGIHHCDGQLTYYSGSTNPNRTWFLKNILPSSIDLSIEEDLYVINLGLVFTSAHLTGP